MQASRSLMFLPLQMMPLVIEAPADTIINATMRGCWGMVELDTAQVLMDGCGGPIDFTVYTPFDTLMGNGGKTSFQLGTHEVIYEAFDQCGNQDRDTMLVTVIDTIPPTAVCVGLRTLSLDGNGMGILPAHVFDGGSTDACFLYYKVRRLVPPSGFDCTTPDNPNYMLDDEVKFCCEDLNDTIMVVLRVYDLPPPAGVVDDTTLSGHFSDCMTGVIIRDKAPPILTCPPDITIECGEHIDFDTLGLPTVADNCDSVIFDISIVRDIDQCGTGEYRRVIIGTDGGGQMDTCVQIIHVINSDPFNGNDTNDLIWPEAYVTVYDCIFVPDTSISGGPIVRDDECSMVDVSWTDEVYSFSRGACSKVIRTFKVRDWCQYDPRVSSACTPANGCWTFEQIIKVIDTIPPVISRPNDTIVPYLRAGCTEMFVSLDTATADTCFFGEQIEFNIEIDFFCDGSIDQTIVGNDASGTYPVGEHKVIYFATDECGNTSIDTMLLTVKDRVLPTPIGKNGISIALTNMGGGMIMSSVWAKDLNASSYDNCSSFDELIFSFSPDTTDKSRTFDCDSIGIRPLRLYVTDKCGNQDYVNVFVRIEDTGGHCPMTVQMSSISGLVSRHDGMKLPNIQMELETNSAMIMSKTDAEGKYMHDHLERSRNYVLTPEKDDDPMLGVSTRDLVLIQRHLLGTEIFGETYQYLCADVNKSGHLSTGDLAALRKLIIGANEEHDHGEEWLFVPKTWKFQDPTDPWLNPWPTYYHTTNLQDPQVVNYTAYKIGDVDMSYSGLNDNSQRSSINVEWSVEMDKEHNQLIIMNSEEMWIAGLQLSLKLIGHGSEEVPEIITALENWGQSNYKYDPGDQTITISWSEAESQWIPEGDIFILDLGENSKATTAVLDSKIKAECYLDDMSTITINLNGQSSDLNEANINSVSIYPNPFESLVNVDFHATQSGSVNIQITNILGAVVFNQSIEAVQGWNHFELDGSKISGSGVYSIQISTDQGNSKFRLIKSSNQ